MYQYTRVCLKPFTTMRSHSRRIANLPAAAAIGVVLGYLAGATLFHWDEALSVINHAADLLPKLLLILSIVFIVAILLSQVRSDKLAIGSIHVPDSIKNSGHTDDLIARRIRGEIRVISDQVSKIKPTDRTETPSPVLAPGIQDEAEALDVVVPGTGISLKLVTDYLRRMLNKKPLVARGYIVCLGSKLAMHLDTHSERSLWVESDDIDGLVKQMAEEYISQANPGIAAGYFSKKGVDYGKKDDFASSEQAFRRAVELGSRHGRPLDTAEALANWGWALARSERLEEAEAKFREALDLCPKSAYTYVAWGNALLKTTGLKRAAEQFREALNVDSGYAYAYASWGTGLRENNNPREAMKMFWRAHRINRNYDYAYVDYGITLLDQYRRPRLAERLFRKALQMKPWHAQAHTLLGRALAARGASVEEAASEFRTAVKFDPGYAYAYVAWGDLLLGSAPSEAAERYQKAVEIDRKHVRAWSGWGNALAAQGDFAGANAKFRMAVKIAPHDDYARVRWGEVLAEQGDPAGAVARFAEASWTHPNYDYLYVAWGKFLLCEQKAPAQAITKLEKALKIEPNHSEALAYLAKAQALLRLSRARKRMRARALRGTYHAS